MDVLETALSIEISCLVLNTLKVGCPIKILWVQSGFGIFCSTISIAFQLSTLYTRKHCLSLAAYFGGVIQLKPATKCKFTSLSQTVVYSCRSINNLFELLETAWINFWPLLFATELRLHYWHCSRDEPCSVFSYAHHALPALWLTPEAPGPFGLHVWSMHSPWTAVLYFEACCWSTWTHSLAKFGH